MKNFLIVVCVIVVVCLLGYAGEYMNEEVVPTNTVSSNNKQNVSSTSGTKVNNNTTKKEENTKVEKEEKVEKVEEEKVEEDENKKEEIEDEKEPVVEENSVSSEEKAINLAKKKYGTSNGVYFRIEQIQSNGVYIVSVRDSETTKDLDWYTVDVNNGTVK